MFVAALLAFNIKSPRFESRPHHCLEIEESYATTGAAHTTVEHVLRRKGFQRETLLPCKDLDLLRSLYMNKH